MVKVDCVILANHLPSLGPSDDMECPTSRVFRVMNGMVLMNYGVT